ncbi:subtilisin-like protease SBT5.4 [Euphorbia lathyris]|uniref:subtilisin-like protease SBT5.4 n=1 Tax=Euphorbia lathyris TaxID=212925 RepID=UPI003313C2E9
MTCEHLGGLVVGSDVVKIVFGTSRKLIGARYFYQGAEASGVKIDLKEMSPRDYEGHGSHTLSTAGGSFVPGASIFGYGKGIAKGGSPHARVAAYKVCWKEGCYGSDILAGFDAAISDGVDVISCSIGGPYPDLYSDSTALGAFFAVKKGIVVVASGGNDGPTPSTVENVAPWLLTVAASTMDRDFFSSAILGDKTQFQGTSLSDKSLPDGKFYPLINAADVPAPASNTADAVLCKDNSLDPSKVGGKIVVCFRGANDRVAKGIEAARAGAVGMILANDELSGDALLADPHFLPATHVSYNFGQLVYKYINSTKNPTASITAVKAVTGIKTTPSMASFSSRGPNKFQPGILKPDVTAPGVNILAAYTEATSASGAATDKRIVPYMIVSGTSMSCPHVSGIVGLIKSLHPDWSPAAIKSAVMTTARITNDNGTTISEGGGNQMTPFAYGAGETRPNSAADPGLVYDMAIDDYLNAICSLGYNATIMKIFGNYECPKDVNLADINYPSITVVNVNGPTTVNRKVKNVGTPGTYTAEFIPPVGVTGSVEPNKLTFGKQGEQQAFKVVIKPEASGNSKGYTFGQLIWSDGKHSVRSPVVVQLI